MHLSKRLTKVRKLGLEVSGEFSRSRNNQGKTVKGKDGWHVSTKQRVTSESYCVMSKNLTAFRNEVFILRQEKWLKGFEQAKETWCNWRVCKATLIGVLKVAFWVQRQTFGRPVLTKHDMLGSSLGTEHAKGRKMSFEKTEQSWRKGGDQESSASKSSWKTSQEICDVFPACKLAAPQWRVKEIHAITSY